MASEKTEMQRHYVMVSETRNCPFGYLDYKREQIFCVESSSTISFCWKRTTSCSSVWFQSRIQPQERSVFDALPCTTEIVNQMKKATLGMLQRFMEMSNGIFSSFPSRQRKMFLYHGNFPRRFFFSCSVISHRVDCACTHDGYLIIIFCHLCFEAKKSFIPFHFVCVWVFIIFFPPSV